MSDHANTFPLISILLLVTVLLIFAMKYLSAALQARRGTMGEEAYRDLAERAVKAQAESAALLTALQGGVSDIGARLASVEKLLKDVG